MACGVHNEAVQGAALSRDATWSVLRANLGDELLAKLLRVPVSSLASYARDTAPHTVERRVAHLATVLQHLTGTYTTWGIRRWFARPRHQLDGRSPLQELVDTGDWTPDSQAATDVATLASALVGMPAT